MQWFKKSFLYFYFKGQHNLILIFNVLIWLQVLSKKLSISVSLLNLIKVRSVKKLVLKERNILNKILAIFFQNMCSPATKIDSEICTTWGIT